MLVDIIKCLMSASMYNIYIGGVYNVSEAADSKRERRIKGPEY